MDLLTQGLLGGALALSAAPRKESRLAAVIGFAAALVADADVLIDVADDSLLQIEYHRHFSHALVFIPLGALLAAAVLWPLLRRQLGFATIYLYALLGYATAGVLDACTSYGTHLLWPFSETRVAWSIIAIIDPVFTLLLLSGLVLGWRRRRPGPARTALLLASSYLLFGLWQHHEALEAAQALAERRGHTAERLLVKPTIANLVLWRSIYSSGDRFYVDAIRIGPGPERIYPGVSAPAFDLERDLPGLPTNSLQALDIERFTALSEGFVAADPRRDGVLIDIRYSMLPTSIAPMWGLDVKVASATQHARFELYRDRPDNYRELFIAMLLGRELPE
ncbi:MAG TPA: metal-dependent hydrolase [Gammaproteobacteria bacterium]